MLNLTPAEWIADQERRGRTVRATLKARGIWIHPRGVADTSDRWYVDEHRAELLRLLWARDPDVARQAQRIVDEAQARGVLPFQLLAAAQQVDAARWRRANNLCLYCGERPLTDPDGSCCWVCRRALSVAAGVVNLEQFSVGRESA